MPPQYFWLVDRDVDVFIEVKHCRLLIFVKSDFCMKFA